MFLEMSYSTNVKSLDDPRLKRRDELGIQRSNTTTIEYIVKRKRKRKRRRAYVFMRQHSLLANALFVESEGYVFI